MDPFNYKYLIFISLFTVSCGGSGGGNSTPIASCENLSLPMASLTGPAITIHLNMADLPARLPVNMPHTQDSHTEYYWNITFDMDGNDIPSAGDLEFKLSHSKMPGSQQGECRFDEMHAGVFRYSPPALVQITGAGIQISGNTMTLKASKSQHPDLVNITAATQFRFSSLGYDVNGEFTTLTGTPAGENLPDSGYRDTAAGAVIDDSRDSLSGLFQSNMDHVDLQSIQIIID